MDSGEQSPTRPVKKSKKLLQIRADVLYTIYQKQRELDKPKDSSSWQMLLECAKLQNFQPILDLASVKVSSNTRLRPLNGTGNHFEIRGDGDKLFRAPLI